MKISFQLEQNFSQDPRLFFNFLIHLKRSKISCPVQPEIILPPHDFLELLANWNIHYLLSTISTARKLLNISFPIDILSCLKK